MPDMAAYDSIHACVRRSAAYGTNRQIVRRPVTMPVVHLWKVKSHIGIVGNKFADRVAVATGRTQTLGRDVYLRTVETVNYDTPSNNRALMVGACTQPARCHWQVAGCPEGTACVH